MSEEKTNQLIGEDAGRKSLTKAIIIFSIIEALVVVFGILYKSLR
jgi:hypothetical protein